MRFALSSRALCDYQKLSPKLLKIADKQFSFLLKNIRHPSLRSKKYDEASDIWQARITKEWRFYFKIRSDEYYILAIVKHPK